MCNEYVRLAISEQTDVFIATIRLVMLLAVKINKQEGKSTWSRYLHSIFIGLLSFDLSCSLKMTQK